MRKLNLTQDQRYFSSFILYYWIIYMSIAVFSPYIGVYYLELGYSSSRIGILSAIGPVAAIVMQPVWGTLSDKARYRRTILQFALLGALIAVLLFPLHQGFFYIFAVTVLYMMFFTSTRPMEDAIALDFIQQTRYKFAPIRLSGTLGYAFMVLWAGRILGDQVHRIFGINALLLGLTFLMTFLLPKTGAGRGQKDAIRITSILKNRELIFVFIYCFIVFAALGFYGSFVSVYMKSFQAANAQIGLAMCLSALSEVPILLLIDRAIKRFGTSRILLFSGLMTAFRMLLFSQATGLSMVILAQLMQGVSYITLYYCSVMIVNDKVPGQLRSTGQAVLALVTIGLSRVVGSIGGGFLSDVVGIANTFRLAFWMVLAATLLPVACRIFTVKSKRSLSQ